VLFWILGLAFNVAGGLIHVLLVIALDMFLVNLISGREDSGLRYDDFEVRMSKCWAG
jgi:hypothetical protein